MRRKLPIILFTLVLFAAAAPVSLRAQSGRGRQLRIQATLRGEPVAPAAVEVPDERISQPGRSTPLQAATGRRAGLIYNDAAANQKNDDGEYHMTRGDKTAGWILLGAVVLATIVILSQD
jgi:hypothetical protein